MEEEEENNIKKIGELQIKAYNEFKLEQEIKAIEADEKKCPIMRDFVDKEYCNSFSFGLGCKYSNECNIYKEFKNG